MKLQQVILRGLAADRPAATTVPIGTLYYSYNTKILERSDGSSWAEYSASGTGDVVGPASAVNGNLAVFDGVTGKLIKDGGVVPSKRRQITLVIDGGGQVITTGFKGVISVPVSCTIQKWRLLADQSGSIVIDVWKDTYANYPPTVADTITAASKPTLAAAIKNEDSVLTGWTKAITVGDILGFNVDSAATVTRVSLTLEVE